MNEGRKYRRYRSLNAAQDLIYFNVKIYQSDLCIGADKKLELHAEKILVEARRKIEDEIRKRQEFLTSYVPLSYYGGSSEIVSWMYEASSRCNVGPMAAVAGAIARYVGEKLLKVSKQVIIENGGDIYINSTALRKIAVYAGASPLSNKLAIELESGIWGVCTSAKTVGHSFSSGNCDAAVCIAKDCSIADAAATVLGNSIKEQKHLSKGVNNIMNIKGITGAIAIMKDKIAVSGNVILKHIGEKK